MQIKLFIDEEMMSRTLINGLRARGIDVISVLDENRQGLDDASQLEFSTLQNRVLCTSNIRDFYKLHVEYLEYNKSHAGIIFVPQKRFSVGEQIKRLLTLIATKIPSTMQSQVEFLSAW